MTASSRPRRPPSDVKSTQRRRGKERRTESISPFFSPFLCVSASINGYVGNGSIGARGVALGVAEAQELVEEDGPEGSRADPADAEISHLQHQVARAQGERDRRRHQVA